MAKFDITTSLTGSLALNQTTINSNTTTSGNVIDLAGYEGVSFYICAATLTDGAYQVNVQHGDASNLSDAADVAAADLINSEPAFVATEDNTVKEVGYVGDKRYVRIQLVSTGVTTGGTFTAVAIRGKPLIEAVA